MSSKTSDETVILNQNDTADSISASDDSSDQKTKILNPLDHTTVDLGDDLLKTKTTLSPPTQKTVQPLKKETAKDWIESAKILMSEGIYNEAKKNLRRVLFEDPQNPVALKLLDQIQDIEVQKLLSEEGQSTFQRRRSGDDQRDPGEVLEQLIDYLDIDLYFESGGEKAFKNKETEEEFKKWISHFPKGASSKDHLDMGVAFIEMELYEYAIKEFEKVRADDPLSKEAKSLKALAFILNNEPFYALLELDALLQNNTVKNEDKIDWAYLKARAHEGLKNYEQAVSWYNTVHEVEPGYRDSFERLKRCEKILSLSSS